MYVTIIFSSKNWQKSRTEFSSSVQIETKQTNVAAKPIIGPLGSEGSNLFFHSSKGQKNTIYKSYLKTESKLHFNSGNSNFVSF